MNIETGSEGDSVVVRLSGEVDLQHSPRLRKVLMELMAGKDAVIVDMSGITYIDSSGIAGLVEAYQMARRQASRFTLAAVSPPAMRVLQLARLDKVFAITATVAEAVGAR